MWFFVHKEKNSNVTPAESREKNQPCTLLDFYDGSVKSCLCNYPIERQYLVWMIPKVFDEHLLFFRRHDIWHFLGGAGVFFVFMFIITIDEDRKYKNRNTINVF